MKFLVIQTHFAARRKKAYGPFNFGESKVMGVERA
jgi:hypothetical protein